MEDRPQDRAEDRRRRGGPLGDEGDAEETTRRVPLSENAGGDRDRGREPTAAPTTEKEEAETRVIRSPGSPGGETHEMRDAQEDMYYSETLQMREERLREEYGGFDWLAIAAGCILAVVFGAVLLPISGAVLDPLGFTLDLSGPVDAIVVTGFVVVGLLLFLSCFLGGYVSGRMVRFDGGRNGAAAVLAGVVLAFVLVLFGSLLPGALITFLSDFMTNTVRPVFENLMQNGAAGTGVLIGALLVALLGGFLGGLLGNRYHTRIDDEP